MKNRWLWPGMIALAVILLTSCSEDGNETGPGKIRIYGMDYELSSGVLWHSSDNRIIETKEYVFIDRFTDEHGEEKSVEVKGFTVGDRSRTNGNFLLSLYDPGLSYNANLHQAQGKGACICFHLASADRQNLTSGTYSWGDLKEDLSFTAYYNSVYDPVELKSSPAEISKGKVTIGKDGAEYSVMFDVETEFGAVIRGAYAGYLDTCRIERKDIMTSTGMKMEALLDTVKTILIAPEWSEDPMDWATPGPDFYQGKAFYSTSGGVSLTAEESTGNVNMDLALAYHKTNKSVVFESPLKMCVWLGHNYECADAWGEMKALNFPCHTRYMLAPDDFTTADYDKVKIGQDLDFVIQGEPRVEIPISSDFPKFVFFETGKGVRGVIKITEASPFSIKEQDVSQEFETPATLISYINPAITVDMKYVATLSDMKIR